MRLSLIFLVPFCMGVSACAGRNSSIPVGQTAFRAQSVNGALVPAVSSTSARLDDYRIGPLDQLKIVVFGEPELGGELPVGLSGRVALPLIGEVQAQGRTTAELSADIAALFNRRYLRNASVAVSVLQTRNLTFTVDGEVKKPGIYEIPGRVSLMQAIALGEGANEYAKLNEVVIFRNIDGVQHAARFDLNDIRAARFPDPEVKQGDVVVVGFSRAAKLYHDVLVSLPGLAGLFVALR